VSADLDTVTASAVRLILDADEPAALVTGVLPGAATVTRSVRCDCGRPPYAPCTPGGDHLGRWQAAERAGLITRRELSAAVSTLTVIASDVFVPDRALEVAA
jgi:hypothetical protein